MFLPSRRRLARLSIPLVAGLLAPLLAGTAPARAAETAGSAQSGSSSSRASITLTRPAGTVAGSVMVAEIASNDDDPGFTAPAGWSVVSDRSIADAVRQAVYLKVATASEPASYTWTLSDWRRVAGGITAYTGIDTASPVDAVAASPNPAAQTSVLAPSVTTSTAGAVLVFLAAINAEGTLNPPAGMAERWEATSPNSANARDVTASLSDAILGASGPSGHRTATASQPGPSIGTLLALRPSGPPPPPDTEAPETTIGSGPSGTVTSSSATFTFTADEPAAFTCRLDGGAATPCTSPRTYTGLADGEHTFSVVATDLSGNTDGSPATRTWTVNAAVSDPVLVGAGDISSCSDTGDSATAALLDNIAGTVFTAGDNVYNDGTAAQFANCYDPTWGRHRDRTLPAAGNHDYRTTGAAGYFGYFGTRAGDPTRGYYDTTLGSWHVVVLNSNCSFIGGCHASSPQEQWLRGVLASSSADCTVAIWHHPRFSSALNHGSSAAMQPLWQALYDHGADVVVNGHDHVYERFAPQTPSGAADAGFGLRQFTVGTGGAGLYAFNSPLPNSEVRNNNTLGVLKLDLRPGSYDWQFVPEAGKTFTDAGTTACHGAPIPPPPPPPGEIVPVASTSSGSGSSRTGITLNRPAGTAAGQVLVAQVASNDDGPGFSAPAGWTMVSDRSIADAVRQAVYVKVATASEPASYTWTLTDWRRVAGGITAYSGVDPAAPVNAVATSVNGTASTAVTAPSLTTTVPNTRLVHLAALNADGAVSPPAGMTERWEAASPHASNTRDVLASLSDAHQPAAGATGPRSATSSRAGRSIATLLALRPAGPPVPDTTPPETTIASGPSGTVTASSATFSFAADEPAAFSCSLDGAAAEPCSSPKTYNNLAAGEHTFSVAATDTAGNADASPASRVWLIDEAAADPVLVGAGDIALCGQPGDDATAALLDDIPGTVFALGDLAYPDGTAEQFRDCYGPSWGRHKARTLLPVPGNHEYNTPGAGPYYDYFGAVAGDRTKGYYERTVGAWHVIVLNSNCEKIGGCGPGSPQEQWLRGVLATSSAQCTVAMFHHPRWTSGTNGQDLTVQPLWQALYDHGADLVLNGHAHLYERFAPTTPSGVRDDAFGIRQITVGTGGRGFQPISNVQPWSVVRNNQTFGVLKLTLHADSYDWQFLPEAGKTFTDAGTAACHGAPPPPPPPGPVAAVASTSSGSGSGRDLITLNRPAGTAAGDVMVAQIASNDDDPGFTAPAGWTVVSDRSIADRVRQAVYVKVAGAAEPASYTWRLPGWRRVAGGITTYRGVDTASPVDAAATSVNGTVSTAVTAPSITTTVAGTMLVQLVAINAEADITPPPGMTEQWEADSWNSAEPRDVTAASSDQPLAGAAVTGSRTATSNRAGVSIATLLALRPEP